MELFNYLSKKITGKNKIYTINKTTEHIEPINVIDKGYLVRKNIMKMKIESWSIKGFGNYRNMIVIAKPINREGEHYRFKIVIPSSDKCIVVSEEQINDIILNKFVYFSDIMKEDEGVILCSIYIESGIRKMLHIDKWVLYNNISSYKS